MKTSPTQRLSILLALTASAHAQLAPATPPPAAAADKDREVVKLNVFQVVAENDDEYRAANTTSGTRYSTPIKDLPMNIEVLTPAFMRDIGALDIRDALEYVSGIQLDTTTASGGSATIRRTIPCSSAASPPPKTKTASAASSRSIRSPAVGSISSRAPAALFTARAAPAASSTPAASSRAAAPSSASAPPSVPSISAAPNSSSQRPSARTTASGSRSPCPIKPAKARPCILRRTPSS